MLNWRLRIKQDQGAMTKVCFQHIEEEATQRLLNSEPPPGGQNIFSSGVVAPRLCAAEGTLRSSRLARRKNLSVQFSIISVARALNNLIFSLLKLVRVRTPHSYQFKSK